MDQKYSDIEYQEIETQIPVQVKQIREILRGDKLIQAEKCEDEFLTRCLRLKDGNLEEAVKLIKTFYSTIQNFRIGWNVKFQPSLFTEFYNSGATVPLIKRDSSGRIILFVRAACARIGNITGIYVALWNPDEMSFDQLTICAWLLPAYVTAEMMDVQRNGFVTVWDFSNFSVKHAWHVNQWRFLTLPRWIQNGFLGRMKEFHGINQPKVVKMIYQAVKPFLKEKLKKRITFHDNVESLVTKIGKDCLPALVGGSLEKPENYIDKNILRDFFRSDQYFQDMIKNGLPSK